MSTSARQRRAQYPMAGRWVPRWKSRLLDAGILLATAAVCVFLFSVSTRFGYTSSQDPEPPIIVRTQVLNACGRPGLAARTADHLSGLTVGRMRFDVIDIGNFNRTDVRRSFVLNYRMSNQQARDILESLNIGPVDLLDAEVGSNDLGLDLALVLGSSVVEPVASVSHGQL